MRKNDALRGEFNVGKILEFIWSNQDWPVQSGSVRMLGRKGSPRFGGILGLGGIFNMDVCLVAGSTLPGGASPGGSGGSA